MNAVFGALLENLQEIKIKFEDTVEAFVKDTAQTAEQKEITVAEFLQSFLPSSYFIRKGPIYNIDANSREIDCVILAPNHPRLITPKRSVILAEGVYAAVEVKPDIATLTDGSEFFRALMQVQSVKQLKRKLIEFSLYKPTPEALHLIPCVIFSKKSRDAIATVEYMKKCVAEGKIKPVELPDIILTLDHGIILHSMHIEEMILRAWVNILGLNRGEKYMVLHTADEMTLCLFLFLLLSVRGPEPIISDFIIKNYLKQCLSKTIEFSLILP